MMNTPPTVSPQEWHVAWEQMLVPPLRLKRRSGRFSSSHATMLPFPSWSS